MRPLACLLICAGALAAAPRIFYSKYFKGSVPEYVAITVERSGQVTYNESKDADQQVRFELTPPQTEEIFGLADKLGRFGHPLESPAKVANIGMKTFRYEEDGKTSEQKFNYSEDPDARLLTDWFDKITETEQSYFTLERTVKFDKLGVNQALLEVQITLDRKRLIAPQQFLPLLDRIAKNESFMHMSRERAASLADMFRAQAPK